MTDTNLHRPDPQFRDRLEWQVTTAFRHAQRDAGNRLTRLRSRLRIAAVIALAATLGTTAGIASAQMVSASQRDSLLEAAQARLYIASARLQLVRATMLQLRRQHELGIVSRAEVAAAEVENRAMEAEARRIQLAMEEVRASGQSPRDDLNAPLVDGRDFVTERLTLDLYVAQQQLSSAEEVLADAERGHRLGTAGPLAPLEARARVARARSTLATLVERRKLRAEFLEKKTPIEELMRRLDHATTRHDAMVANEELMVARERVMLLEKAQDAGQATELDVLRAQVAVREAEMALLTISRRLRGGG